MNEQKFEELLLKNNKYLLDQMDQKIDKALIKNNKKLEEELTERLTNKITENVTTKLTEDMTNNITESVANKVTENITNNVTESVATKLTGDITNNVTKKIMFEVKKEIKKSEERQNSKLAYLEYTYGEKISAIFDKLQSMEEIMMRAEREYQKYRKTVDHHSDILYSHDLRISDIERKFNSN